MRMARMTIMESACRVRAAGGRTYRVALCACSACMTLGESWRVLALIVPERRGLVPPWYSCNARGLRGKGGAQTGITLEIVRLRYAREA